MNLQEQVSRIKEMMNPYDTKGWGNLKKKLSKEFQFDDFKESMKFVNKVARISEKQNHHPDIQIKYNKVTISITDHEKGGVSEKCHKFVNSVDKL